MNIRPSREMVLTVTSSTILQLRPVSIPIELSSEVPIEFSSLR
jgi:hypothetical protein